MRSISISRGGWHLASLEETHGGLPSTLPRCQISLPFFFQFPRLEIVLKEGLPQGMYISSPPKKHITPWKTNECPLKRGRVFNRKHKPSIFAGGPSFVFRERVLDCSLREFFREVKPSSLSQPARQSIVTFSPPKMW